jgi:hypothetical protein
MHILACVGFEDAALIGAGEFLAVDCNRFFIAYSMCFISLWAKAHFAGSFFCSMDYFVASESTAPPHALHRPRHRAVHCGQRGQRAAHARGPALALTLVFLGQLAAGDFHRHD